MAKKPLRYSDQLNFLALEGTYEKLVAVSFYIGGKGKMAVGAKNMLDMGLETFLSRMTPAERRRYDEILASVQTAARLKRLADQEAGGS